VKFEEKISEKITHPEIKKDEINSAEHKKGSSSNRSSRGPNQLSIEREENSENSDALKTKSLSPRGPKPSPLIRPRFESTEIKKEELKDLEKKIEEHKKEMNQKMTENVEENNPEVEKKTREDR